MDAALKQERSSSAPRSAGADAVVTAPEGEALPPVTGFFVEIP